MSTPAGVVTGFFSGHAYSLAGDRYDYEATWSLDERALLWSAVVSSEGLSRALPTGKVPLTSLPLTCHYLGTGVQDAVRSQVEQFIESLEAPTRPDVRSPRE